LLDSINSGRIQRYEVDSQAFAPEIVKWNSLKLDLDMGEDFIKCDDVLFKLKIEDMQELLIDVSYEDNIPSNSLTPSSGHSSQEQKAFNDRLEACVNGDCTVCKGVPSSTSDDSLDAVDWSLHPKEEL
jgi:hypothetical protein